MQYSLEPIADKLGRANAKHLLDRSTFGCGLSSIETFSSYTIEEALTELLKPSQLSSQPLCISPEDPDVRLGDTWINAPYNAGARSQRLKSLKNWWISLYLNQENSLTEKMHLFWHNHFVVEIAVVKRPRYLYHYIKLLYENGLNNFKTLLDEITICPAMLVYLNGVRNVNGSPNENYGRELFELFSIGKGPLISEGNYTNYTENDIQEAARVLTGWKINVETGTSYFKPSVHDEGDKQFSAVYNASVISNDGDSEYKALTHLILNNKETARHIVRKLYRWFVYYTIDDQIETQIIEPLAEAFYASEYDISVPLKMLLSSQHFFDAELRGAYLKNPLEHILGTLRKVNLTYSDNELINYELWNTLYFQSNNQEMKIGDPPDVAGWPQWYLGPQYGQLWINAVTIPKKTVFTDKIVNSGYTRQNYKYIIDSIALVSTFESPFDPNQLISDLVLLFFPMEAQKETIDYLKEILIPGLPDFEWTLEWNKYINNPEDNAQKKAVESALKDVLKAMFRMPDYYLI